MMRSLWTAATGMVAQQLNIDVISHNLANVNTSGFKKSRAEFEDLMYQNMRIAGSATEGDSRIPVGIQVGMGVRPTAVHKFFSQGDFQNSGNPLDIAIEGDGFFQVLVNGEPRYTRAGAFKLNQDGTVVTANGYVLQPEFTVPAETKNVVVTEAGHIAALDANGQELAAADIPLYTFINPAGLDAIGRNLYVPSEASGEAVEGVPGEDNVGTLAQGFLEMSNVEVVDEMVNMIVGQRAYEMNSKAISTSDQMLQTAVNLKR
ncbi:flagellar basal-body rod protein FlgG [Nitratidesulfovibrio vulgaris]|jgi:flagellar basal-body rod protein FlgG|uniref:Flagellar basal-body rod protein FlgG n=2 Tax=Nitratidesulfovibrio vulgaris TaxID=881 RepID=Q72EQ6_NITV2|nr:flagellar basal-body rod protein FlgG [Nitratidesulfovibrio vulgaris]HBW17107.1 flagellar basal-body rod protein FlgG [Desulfovibrio sp.]AAS94995.1 flagellar basal-body rod protein FlgG [Nitratidesulfovibrio vulgaris str. Hildenborough]ABM29444.1 flagellar basal-body rod protein FlgG [Nitratidesulfovibrio vulgaris DP4]ADP85640.1 flagellar basal-body rod protein FlgG [Nitratidesulfovibrio vulgaris RCH1]WCB47215.1 flagellar basal-body rod protein FlgG [Nitratidesulfovibrio vulgaris]